MTTPLVNWVFAAILLVALIFGVGMVFYFFLADEPFLLLGLGLALVGAAGGALRDVYPSESSVHSGAVGSVVVLLLYAAAMTILGVWKLVDLIGLDATAFIAGLTGLVIWLKVHARSR